MSTKEQPKWLIGLKAAARSLVALVPALFVRWYMTHSYTLSEAEADTVATVVGTFIKFLFSTGTAVAVKVQ